MKHGLLGKAHLAVVAADMSSSLAGLKDGDESSLQALMALVSEQMLHLVVFFMHLHSDVACGILLLPRWSSLL